MALVSLEEVKIVLRGFAKSKSLFVYHMTHTSSPKRVVFELDLVEISYISIKKMIVKCFANHASKECDFSHFFPY